MPIKNGYKYYKTAQELVLKAKKIKDYFNIELKWKKLVVKR